VAEEDLIVAYEKDVIEKLLPLAEKEPLVVEYKRKFPDYEVHIRRNGDYELKDGLLNPRHDLDTIEIWYRGGSTSEMETYDILVFVNPWTKRVYVKETKTPW